MKHPLMLTNDNIDLIKFFGTLIIGIFFISFIIAKGANWIEKRLNK